LLFQIPAMNRSSIFFFLIFFSSAALAQDYRWQQHVSYTMKVHLDVTTHRITGTQNLVYENKSGDTLRKVYYHLYFNAFQPGSMMDIHSRSITDPDPRVTDRISKLSSSEVGYQHILTLRQNGKDVSFSVQQTVLEVTLAKPIMPHSKAVFDMTFESQVPLQIRRSGRDNREGVAFSMTQWYPKMAEYDFQGWHADQYVAREFHGVWGDFDITMSLDPAFVVAATGKLQNPQNIGYGYEKAGTKVTRPAGDLIWHFVAKNVIDFAWAADPEYTHDKVQVPSGPELHFFYQKGDKTTDMWSKLPDYAVKVFQYNNTHFGKYSFDTYSIIQGGDGGMEYPMCTLILGEARSINGLAGLMAHEVTHSWYQMALASNESLYPWMDEGFTDFASGEAMASILGNNIDKSHDNSYAGYFALVASGKQEPASQHSDHYSTNRAYSVASYSMGAIFLEQLKYLIGDAAFYKGMRLYYNEWKMRHPEPNDFIRVMEKVSGLQLHWYLRYWIFTTKHIDYGITSADDNNANTLVSLERIGEFPMPLDIEVTYTDGKKEMFYIPTNELLGKKAADPSITRTDLGSWSWVAPTYTFSIPHRKDQIVSLEIDPLQRMADINRKNNKLTLLENGNR
jgi:hypothetical protein